jgi:tRNA threonylcarbamoyladenosine biosynthesis protein TsaB
VKLLAFDTSTELLTLAVQAPGMAAPLEREAAGGAKASAALIPAVLDLLAAAGLRVDQLDAIVFGAGPGSFTGLRTACSVAQGLALGAGIPVLPLETLQAVAEEARQRTGADRVLALLDARMGEVYGAHYEFSQGTWARHEPIALCQPQDVRADAGWTLAGNVFGQYRDRLPAGAAQVEALPRAAAMLRLAPALLATGQGVDAGQALPLYVRDKVAQTTAERLAARDAAGGGTMKP